MSWMSKPSQPVTIRPTRSLGGITFDVVIEEHHEDSLTITEHPVEQGAAVSDHAWRQPALVVIRAGVSDSSGDGGGRRSQSVYDALLALQASREPFDIVTGKRAYRNMLLESLSATTDAATENALVITAECREVIIVRTAVTSVPPRARHANPNRTGAITDTGQKQAQPRRSALSSVFGPGEAS
ncbi:phage baseplate protein [Telmatospirillum sp. J64-1]|uniref:phage baseplate protein n=1 Tax=Telmatospirillum sp. J64-1 TaxID=2502183 RepID=UPI00115E86AF|nr:hypothetical protein [Telmatospirillum sp. J64-1]